MLTLDQVLRHTRPGPRYTSYPTAPCWMDDPPPGFFHEAARAAVGPVSVYVHVPFCKEQCTFCGCNMVVAGRQDAGDRYLAALERQLGGLPGPELRPLLRLHVGGGTPTWLDERQLDRLFHNLARRFTWGGGAEVGVEVDPDVTSDAQVERLARHGVNRLSLGVQDLDPAVLAAVNRPQSALRVERILALARDLGMRGLNLDLMYGLPGQTLEGFRRTLDRVVALGPDRIAAFGYAHVPWLKPHQRRLASADLPSPTERAALWLLTQEHLTACGYTPIGLDHFALADDALARAAREGTLRRDFMGYTDRPRAPMIGLGPSAISEFPDRFVQAPSKLAAWYRAVEGGEEPLERGCRLDREDQRRAWVIEQLMCALRVDFDRYTAMFHEVFHDRFEAEIVRLQPLVEDGLVETRAGALVVPEDARMLVRNVAMVFDAHLSPAGGVARFSSTV